MKQDERFICVRESWRNKASLFSVRIKFPQLPPSSILPHLHPLNPGTSIRGAVWEARTKSQVFIFVRKVGTSDGSLGKYAENRPCSHLNSLHSQPQLVQKRPLFLLCTWKQGIKEFCQKLCLHSNHKMDCLCSKNVLRLLFFLNWNLVHFLICCIFVFKLNNREEPVKNATERYMMCIKVSYVFDKN